MTSDERIEEEQRRMHERRGSYRVGDAPQPEVLAHAPARAPKRKDSEREGA